MALPRIRNTVVVEDTTKYGDLFFNQVDIRYYGTADEGAEFRPLISLRYHCRLFDYDTNKLGASAGTGLITDLYLLASQFPRLLDGMEEFLLCLGEIRKLQNGNILEQAEAIKSISTPELIVQLDAIYYDLLDRKCDPAGYITHLGLMGLGLAEVVRQGILDGKEYQDLQSSESLPSLGGPLEEADFDLLPPIPLPPGLGR